MLDAAALAAILDPERKVPGLWRERYFIADAEIPMCPREFVYIGPPDIHTSREHCWRMEEWLIHRDCQITIDQQGTSVEGGPLTGYSLIASNLNHAAALNAAIERISNE